MASIVIRNLNDLLGRMLKERAARTGRTVEEEGRGIMEAALSQPEPPERQREQVGKRLNRLLHMLNEGQQLYKFTISEMASHLRLNTAGDLESYFLGEHEAPFELLDQIADTFGVNPEWLKFGHGTEPFKRAFHNEKLLELLKTVKAEMVYFVRELDETGSATVFFKINKWKYEGIRHYWHVSDKVGATGERQLFELWQVLDKIEKNSNLFRKLLWPGSTISCLLACVAKSFQEQFLKVTNDITAIGSTILLISIINTQSQKTVVMLIMELGSLKPKRLSWDIVTVYKEPKKGQPLIKPPVRCCQVLWKMRLDARYKEHSLV